MTLCWQQQIVARVIAYTRNRYIHTPALNQEVIRRGQNLIEEAILDLVTGWPAGSLAQSKYTSAGALFSREAGFIV